VKYRSRINREYEIYCVAGLSGEFIIQIRRAAAPESLVSAFIDRKEAKRFK
jgi:hypothetical protein